MPFLKKKKEFDSDDFEIEDIENYRGEPDLKFSHELLVMEQLRRATKSFSQEMKKGFEERKEDRMGNLMAIKNTPDTRKESAECVITLKNLMIGHISDNDDITTTIKDLFEQLDTLQKEFIKMEQKAWDNIPEHIRKQGSNWADRWEHIPNTLNYDHYYGEKFLQESVKIYRELFEEIILLLHRMDYFKASKI